MSSLVSNLSFLETIDLIDYSGEGIIDLECFNKRIHQGAVDCWREGFPLMKSTPRANSTELDRVLKDWREKSWPQGPLDVQHNT